MTCCDMCGKKMNNLDRRLVKISPGLLQCEFAICSKCSKKLKKFIYFERARNNKRRCDE